MFYNAEGLKALHVDFLSGDVEFLVGFLTGSVALEVDDGVFKAAAELVEALRPFDRLRDRIRDRIKIHPCCIGDSLGIIGTLLLLKSLSLYELIADSREVRD